MESSDWEMMAFVRQLIYSVLFYFVIRAIFSMVEWLRVHYLLSKLPRGPPASSILLGNFEEATAKGFHKWHLRCANEFGRIFPQRVLWLHVIHVSDPQLCAEILRSPEYEKSPLTYHPLAAMMSDKDRHSLLSAPTKSAGWKLVRKGVMPAFSPNNIRQGFKHVLDVNARVIAKLEAVSADEVVDMDSLLKREALDVIGLVGFGYNMGATSETGGTGRGRANVLHALEIADAAAEEVERRWAEPAWRFKFWKRDVWEGKRAFRAYTRVMAELLADVKARAAAGQLLGSSVAGHLLQLRQPGSAAPLPDDLLLPEVAVFFFAGEDTSSHTGAWTLYLVSQHPEVEAKIVDELDRAGLLAARAAPQPRQLQYEDLSKLTYLNMVIKESMRMLPVAGGTVREASRDVLLGGKYLIPKGTSIFLPLHAIHNTWRNFEEPERFIPERWTLPGAQYEQPDLTPESTVSDKIEAAASVGAPAVMGGKGEALEDGDADDASAASPRDGRAKRFLPFMEGPRSCAGQALATMNLTATLAKLYGHFSFRLADEMGGPEEVRAAEHLAITMYCDKGMKMHAVPRAKA